MFISVFFYVLCLMFLLSHRQTERELFKRFFILVLLFFSLFINNLKTKMLSKL